MPTATIDREETQSVAREVSHAPVRGPSTPTMRHDARVEPMPIEYLRPNPWQPRLTIDPGTLAPLVASIREFGFMGNIEARYDPEIPGGRLQVVYGHRRVRAAELAGLRTIPTRIVDRSDEDMRRIAFIENATSEKLTYWEEGLHFKRMQDEMGLTIAEVGELVGKAKGYVQNRLDVLRLPEGSVMREAAMASEIDMTSANTLLNLFSSKKASENELTEFVERLKSGLMTADDLKAIRKARNATLPMDAEITDDGRKIHTVNLPPRLIEAQLEAELLAIEEDLPPAPDPDRIVGKIGFAQDRPVISFDRTIIQTKSGRDWALATVDQLRGVVPHLRRNVEKADFTELAEPELDELREHKSTINELLPV